MIKFLKRIFKAYGQSRLESYLRSRHITDASQLESHIRDFERKQQRGYI
jgi:predicted GIY-YIG superfamily endonuclease